MRQLYNVTIDPPVSSDGVFGSQQTISISADGAVAVLAADVDGDGDNDALSASYFDDKIAWYKNNGSGSFTGHTMGTAADGAASVFAADVNRDGHTDILSASMDDNRIVWYENDGNGGFAAHTISDSATGAASVFAADMDGDGDVDVLAASPRSDTIAWYENDGNQQFTDHVITTSADWVVSVFAADLDGDGDMDIQAAAFYDNTVAWYENEGGGTFTIHPISTSVDRPVSVFAADVDGDGDRDVLSASRDDDKIAWYENDGSGVFASHVITTAADGAKWVSAADLNGDGHTDVLSASSNDDKIAWYENDGSGGFTAHPISITTDAAQCVYAADMDGDGDLDVLSASFNDNEIAWYENLSGTSGPDEDTDGISDTLEKAGPNGGDGNKDGVLDSQQDSVASFPNAVDGSYVTLATSSGTVLENVTATGNPSEGDAPSGVSFPVGFFDFTITGVGNGGSAVVTVYPESGESVNTYYKYGPTADNPADHWYPFMYDPVTQTGAVIIGNGVRLYFVDGERGDDDLTKNGRIVDPGAPGGDAHLWQTAVGLDGSNDLLIEDINGADSDDALVISISSDNVRVSDPNNPLAAGTGAVQVDLNTVDVPIAGITGAAGIIVDALGGDDSLTIDFGGGNLTVPIDYRGGTQNTSPVGDTLALAGGATFADATFNFTDSTSGSIAISGNQTITYTGLEPIHSTIDATNVTLNYGSTGETITVGASGSQTQTTSTAGETVTFKNPSGTLAINAGGGDDTIDITGLGSGFAADLIIDGQTGSGDAIKVTGAVNTGGGNVRLTASGGVRLEAAVDTGGGALSLDADSDENGSGTFKSLAIGSVSGNVAFDASNTFEVELGGTTVDTQYDRLSVTGAGRTIALSGTKLVVQFISGFTPTLGGQDVFRIVDSTGTGSTVSGLFKNADGTADLPEGSTFTVDGTTFRINYNPAGSPGDVILIEAGNTSPVVDLNGVDDGGLNFTATFVEDAAAVTIADADATIADGEQTELANLELVVNANPDGAAEVLTVGGTTFPLNADKTDTATVGSTTFNLAYVASSRKFGISRDGGGTAPKGDFQTLLRGATYDNTDDTPTTTGRTINVTANDGVVDSRTATATITVAAANDPPTLTSFGAVIDRTDEDTEVELTFAELMAQGDEADVDGTVTALVVQAVNSGTLKIGANATAATPFATGSNDTIDATKNAYWMPAADASGTLNASTVVACDDDGGLSTGAVTVQVEVVPAAAYHFSAGTFSASEGDATHTTSVVRVTRSANTTGASSVQVALAAGTVNGATVGTDFTAGPITVSFADGETSKAVPIELLGETTVELDETIALTLANPSGNGNISTTQYAATLTLTNDDSAVISVNAPSETEGSALGFVVTISNPVDVAVTAGRETQDGTATTADSDYAALASANVQLFAAGSTTAMAVPVSTTTDNTVELEETLDLVLSTLAAGGRDVTFSSGGATLTGTGTIENDDNAVIGINAPSETEGSALGFSVTISNPVDVAVTAGRETQDGTATTADSDYAALASANVQLFAAGSTTAMAVPVSTTTDNTVELEETLDLVLSTLAAGGRDVTFSSGGPTLTGTGTIEDDDSATLSIDNVALEEGDSGTTAFTFTVRLADDVDVPLTVSFTTAEGVAQDENGDGDYQSAIDTVNFNGDADEQRTIAISVTADDVLEPDEDFFVNLTGIDADGRDVTFADDQGRGQILRDESEGNLVSTAAGEISRSGETDGYLLEVSQGGVYSVQVWDYRDAGLDPDAVEILDAEGNLVPVLEVIRDATADGPPRSAVVVDFPPGSYRVFVRSQNGTAAPYRIDLRLPGAVNGERIVGERAVRLAEVAMLQRHFGFDFVAQELFSQKLGIDLSVDQFRFEFDANLNGHIDAMDMNAIITNYASGSAIESLATWAPLTSGAGSGRSNQAESAADFKVSDVSFSVFQNPETRTDVDANGQVTPHDALLAVNTLNAIGSTSIDVLAGQNVAAREGEPSAAIAPPFVDVNGDYQITPLDVLLVVNDLNSAESSVAPAGPDGEGVAFARADIGRPSLATASRSGDCDTIGLFGASPPIPPGLVTEGLHALSLATPQSA